LKKGDVDERILTSGQWTQETIDGEFYERNTKVRGVEWVYFYFGWNLQEPSAPFFKELKVRQAMGYAFEHEEMLKTICFGLYEPCAGIFHPDALMAPKPMSAPYKYDIDKAEELLDEAGWVDSDGDGIRDKMIDGKLVKFDFTIICSQVPQRIAICNLLKQNLKEIGIECTVRPLEATSLTDALIKHKYQANFGGWGTGADPSTLKNIWETGEGRNFNQYSNPEVDKLLKQAKLEFDPSRRNELYGKIHQLIYDDQPVTFLYNQSSFYGFSKRLRGYKFSPRGPFHYGPGFGSIWKARMQLPRTPSPWFGLSLRLFMPRHLLPRRPSRPVRPSYTPYLLSGLLRALYILAGGEVVPGPTFLDGNAQHDGQHHAENDESGNEPGNEHGTTTWTGTWMGAAPALHRARAASPRGPWRHSPEAGRDGDQ